MTIATSSLNPGFQSHILLSIIECAISSSCNCSGLYAPDHRSTLLSVAHNLPLTQNASSRAMRTNLIHSICTLPGIPLPGYSASHHMQVYRPGIHTHSGAGDTAWQPITLL